MKIKKIIYWLYFAVSLCRCLGAINSLLNEFVGGQHLNMATEDTHMHPSKSSGRRTQSLVEFKGSSTLEHFLDVKKHTKSETPTPSNKVQPVNEVKTSVGVPGVWRDLTISGPEHRGVLSVVPNLV